MKKVNKLAEQQKDRQLAKQLVGRTIVRAEPNSGVDEKSESDWMHDWVLTLDDGSQLAFVVEEHPDGGEYGIQIVRRKPA